MQLRQRGSREEVIEDMDNLAAIRNEIVATSRALLDKGLVTGTWGNVSARVPESDRLVITPTGRDYRTITAGDIAVVDGKGVLLDGQEPSSETPLHLAIYRHRLDVKAIVHTHSVFASGFAVARRAILPVIEDLVQLVGGEVAVADYALPGTQELAHNAVAALADKQAVLLANHGMVGCGQTLREAMLACELVEKAAQICVYAGLLGGARVLSEEDVAVMRQFYLEKYRQRQGGELSGEYSIEKW